MVVVTGGMSVDPDDQTPTAIRSTGAEVVTYGAPTFPRRHVHVRRLGRRADPGVARLCHVLPGVHLRPCCSPVCWLGSKWPVKTSCIWGTGDFCATCDVCRYPVCPFGK